MSRARGLGASAIAETGSCPPGQAQLHGPDAARCDPARKYVQSVSGGIASAASAVLGHQLGLSQTLVFADTTSEEPDLYRFVHQIAEAIRQPLIVLKDGRDPWDVFVDEKFIGNSRIAPCSKILKTKQVRRWMLENAPDATLVLGMYRDEEDRLDRAAEGWAPIPVTSLLIENHIFPGKAREMIEALGIRTPALYDDGFPHDNCGGGCVRAGQGQWATLLERRPEVYAHHEARMEWAMEAIGPTAKPFLKIIRKGVAKYLTLKQFREQVQAGTLKPKMYEMGGCGCFVDDLFSWADAA